jgi:hypothetical protein
MTLGSPLHQNVTGEAAYTVVPAALTFKVQGRPVVHWGDVHSRAHEG